ncbi:MAG: hypothetical protein PHR79_05475 [Bacteroidales bacterium]|nr:hypothetical protein [Bacteroidales bacterium]
MKRLWLILGALLFIFMGNSQAQTLKSFDEDFTQTVLNVKAYCNTLSKDLKPQSDALVKEFEIYWNSENIYEDQKEHYIETINFMVERKLRQFRQFEAFTHAFMAATSCKQEDESYDAWLKGVKYVMRNKTTQLVDYLDNSRELMSQGILSKNSQVEWFSSGQEFAYEFKDEPIVNLGLTDVVGRASKDSVVIYKTKAYYYPLSREIVAQGGVVNWERAGFDKNKVYAKMKNVRIDTRRASFTADSVLYHNSEFFAKPLLGYFEDKATLIADEDRVTYPRFRSYDYRIRLNNYFENVDFEGGIEMRGARFIGAGDEDNPAFLIFKKDNKDFVVVATENLTLRKSTVSTSSCRAYIFIGQDTIYHSSLEMKYNDEIKELVMYRTNQGLSQAPFFNTFHKLDMYFEAIYWKTDEELMEFKMIQGPGEARAAVFESNDFFDQSRLDKIKQYHQTNPLLTLYRYYTTNKTITADFNDLVKHFGYSAADVRSFLMEMAILGFIDYETSKEKVHMRPKMKNFLLANAKKQDYDIIQFVSQTRSKNNAKINLMNFDLHLYGVKEVFLSDSQIVSVYPRGEEIIMKENRDFEFSGMVRAGLFDFNASQCRFHYNHFKIEMNIIDSLMFYVEDKSQKPNYMGEYPLVLVKNSIQDLKGTIEIDEHNNKSSSKYSPRYPIFTSLSPSGVYYDKPETFKGVYDRNRFYYRVLPFVIEQLDDFETDSLEFNGYLVSGGIFEDIDKPLRVRKDFSLGFVHKTGPSGMNAYGGKGVFTNTLDLSNKGLLGIGKIDYLNSTGQTKDSYFFLDSANAYLDTYDVREQASGTEYPSVVGKNVYMHWEPYNDRMLVYSDKKPLRIFKEADLDGNIEMTPSGALAAGEINFEKAQLFSDKYSLKHHEIVSDTLDFNLKSQEFNDLAFKTKNQNGKIDLQERNGNFTSNGDASLVEFPINLYKTNCTAFEWKMDEEEIVILYDDPYKTTDINGTPIRELYNLVSTGNELVSTHPAQDSLYFRATKANYSLKKYIIEADGVRYIEVADAIVVPRDGNVKIYKNAEMQSFENARILANTTTKYHEIYDAKALIGSKKWYTGKGKIDYIDELEGKQVIILDTVYVDKASKTYAKGKIAKESDFTLSPHFGFYGDVSMIAENEFFYFSGGASLKHGCDTVERAPLAFKAEINPKEILIPATKESKDVNGGKIANAVLFSPDGGLYTAFATSKERVRDAEIVSAYGYLTYSHEMESFLIASAEKIADTTLPGNMLVLDKRNCITKGSGAIDIGARLGRVEMKTFGKIESYMMSDSATIELSATLNFHFDEKLLKYISDYIEGSTNLDGIDIIENEKYHRAIIEIMGNQEGEKVINELFTRNQLRRIPPKLLNTFVFSDITLKWSPETQSFISVGDLGIAMMGNAQVNRFVPGILEIQKKRSSDELNLYLNIDGTWFHFWHRNNTMQIFSYDLEFNKMILAIDAKKRVVSAEKGTPRFEYRTGREANKKNLFKRLGIEDSEDKDD